MPARGGVVPQSAGHSHRQVAVLHVVAPVQPPQSGRHSTLQIAGFVLHALPAGGGFGPQSGQSHSHVARLHVETGPGGAPGQPVHWYWQVLICHCRHWPRDRVLLWEPRQVLRLLAMDQLPCLRHRDG